MSYTKVNWQDSPSTATPITAANLNHMDDEIYNTSSTLNITSSTWTPTLRGGTTAGAFTYSTRTGNYYTIGNLVYVSGSIQISAITTRPAGEVQIAGLPFSASHPASATTVYVSGGVNDTMRRGIFVTTSSAQEKYLVLRGLTSENTLYACNFSSSDNPECPDIALSVGGPGVYMDFCCVYRKG